MPARIGFGKLQQAGEDGEDDPVRGADHDVHDGAD